MVMAEAGMAMAGDLGIPVMTGVPGTVAFIKVDTPVMAVITSALDLKAR